MSKTATPSIDSASVEALRRSFRGDLIRPGDPGYEEQRRIWNGSIDRRPALIARRTVADVIAAVRFARERAPPRGAGGGHSFPGLCTCDGGIPVDLAP